MLIALLGWKQNADVLLFDDVANYSVLLAIAAAAATPSSLVPRQVMWHLTPREIDARYFAWRNKDFAPIALATSKD